jgi:hypothetical protein
MYVFEYAAMLYQKKGPEKFPALNLVFESGAPVAGAPFLFCLMWTRVVVLRGLEFRSRAVANRAGFLPIR